MVMAVVGVLGSVLAANAVARDDAGKSEKSFDRSSAHIAAILQLAIQRQSDLVVNAGA
jgi:hypothetical protein